MSGNFDRIHQQSTSYQFRNPLDELETIANNYSDEASDYHIINNQFHNLNLNSNIPVGNLLDGFDVIDQPCTSTGQLIDISETKYANSRNQPTPNSENIVALLQRNLSGLKFDQRNGKSADSRFVQLIPGMLVRPMDENDGRLIQLNQQYRQNKSEFNGGLALPMEVIPDTSICAMITSSDVMKITNEQALQLLSLNPQDRLKLYNDIERLTFLMSLKVGDRVDVDVDEHMPRVPAKVTWIGERPEEHGIWYNVDFDWNSSQWPPHDSVNRHFDNLGPNFGMSGSSSLVSSNSRLYHSPNQLHMPLKGGGVTALYDNRRPVAFHRDEEIRVPPKPPPRERNIPIHRKDDSYERQSRGMRPPEVEYNTSSQYNSNYYPVQQSPCPSSSSSQPSRSKSVHTMPASFKRPQAAIKNEVIRDDQSGFRIGDTCIWNNNGVDEKGVVKYIGYLKGHKTLYAGVEFKNRIGAGTGVFNKEQLFLAKDGHAGFVELSSLESPSSSSSHNSTNSSSHRRRLSSSRSQQMPASAGTAVSVPVNGRSINNKQASIESLSDVPPPQYTPPSPPRASSAAAAHQHPPPLPPKPIAHIDDYLIDPFEIGGRVTVSHLGAERTGTVKWIGDTLNEEGVCLERSAIVQLDEDVPTAWRRSETAGNYTGSPIFGGVLVPVISLRRNRTSPSSVMNTAPVYSMGSPPMPSSGSRRNGEFGSMDSGVEKQRCGPAKDIQSLLGRQKGIQGYCNSCYIDATLYAMFAQTTVFDFLLDKSVKGNEKAVQFQKILAHEVVWPLRKVHYVRADHVMKLRKVLAELMPHMTGLTSEEKDPEEILTFIFADVFNADPFIKLIGPKQAKVSQFLVPIVIDSANDWQGRAAATSQHLLERHLREAQMQFTKPPPVLIMQLPRYGQQKVFDKIIPLERIDITPFVTGATPACSKCGSCAEVYCPTCFLTRTVFFTDIVYCDGCFHRSHVQPEIADHMKRDLFPSTKQPKKPSSHKMVLSAVLCIETSHYVAFVRTPSGQWVFFDSMADREGLSDGFNVPVVRECVDITYWLSITGWNRLREADETGQLKPMCNKLDPLVGRLLSDSYICFYEDASTVSNSNGSSTIINNFKNLMK